MNAKWMCMILMLALVLILPACGNSSENGTIKIEPQSVEPQSEEDYLPENNGNESSDSNVTNLQDNGTDKKRMEVGTVKDSAFSGKVVGCYYADGSRIIVEADELYLYDTGKGEIIASADISLGDLCVQTYADGYFVVGQGNGSGGNSNGSFAASESSGGIKGYILNKDFVVQDTISFDGLLSEDFILQTTGIAVSQDGKQIAFGGFQGLYLYDISSRKVRTILNYSEEGTADKMQNHGQPCLYGEQHFSLCRHGCRCLQWGRWVQCLWHSIHRQRRSHDYKKGGLQDGYRRSTKGRKFTYHATEL